MILRTEPAEARAILGAMRAIGLAHGPAGLTEADRLTIEGASTILFGAPAAVRVEDLPTPSPAELAAALPGGEAAVRAARVLAVTALVDGVLDADKIRLVIDYAGTLGVREDYLRTLSEAAEGHMQEATACMLRKNADSFPGLHIDDTREFLRAFLPYRERPDPDLAVRYESLGELPPGSFGRAFWDHFKRNRFAFPGDPNALSEHFTTPHDSSHVLSGYSTSQAGEICVSTFISGMHPDHPMTAEVLPVMFSWHLGIPLTEVAGTFRGAFEPHRFWTAWQRGLAVTRDIVAPGWDFWAAAPVPLEELRAEYAVPALDPDLAA